MLERGDVNVAREPGYSPRVYVGATKFNDKRGSLYAPRKQARRIYTVEEKYSGIDRLLQQRTSWHLDTSRLYRRTYSSFKVNARYSHCTSYRASRWRGRRLGVGAERQYRARAFYTAADFSSTRAGENRSVNPLNATDIQRRVKGLEMIN